MNRAAITTTILALASAAFFFLAQSSYAGEEDLGEMKLDSKIESMKKAGVGEVTFPHTLHEQSNSCDDCHPDVFASKRGTNDITMQKNMDGEYCGMCHDSMTAFPLYQCAKCHEVIGRN